MALLSLCGSIIKQKQIFWRYFLSAFIGTAFAVFLPFVDKLVLLYKLLTLFLVMAFAFKYYRVKQYIFAVFVFGGVSFAIGGAVYACVNIFANTFVSAMPSEGVFWLICLMCVSARYLLRQIGHFWRRGQISAQNNYEADITIMDTTFSVKCFSDTGNKLADDLTLKPVAVISGDVGTKFLQGGERTLKVKTVASVKELPLIYLDKLVIHTKQGDRDLGRQLAVVSDGVLGEYQLILNGGL